jgi:hypothetical protein
MLHRNPDKIQTNIYRLFITYIDDRYIVWNGRELKKINRCLNQTQKLKVGCRDTSPGPMDMAATMRYTVHLDVAPLGLALPRRHMGLVQLSLPQTPLWLLLGEVPHLGGTSHPRPRCRVIASWSVLSHSSRWTHRRCSHIGHPRWWWRLAVVENPALELPTLALYVCRTACSSQCGQKTDLMEETRQYIYTSTLSLTCGFLRPKRGPKVGYNIFILYCACRVLNSRPLGSDTI